MSLEVRGLVFVGTRTPAAAAMADFARDVLGLVPRADADADATCFGLPDGSSFAVQATHDLELAERTVGFLVDDLDAALGQLRARGVATDGVAETDVGRYVHFRAPDGQLYELVQQR